MSRTTAILSLVAWLAASGCAAPTKPDDGAALGDFAGKADGYGDPVDRGPIFVNGDPVSAELKDGSRFLSWRFETSGPTRLNVRTGPVPSRSHLRVTETDTEIYLQQMYQGAWTTVGYHDNDLDSPGMWSDLHIALLTGGQFRVVVAGVRGSEGTFSLEVRCDGPGCPEPPATCDALAAQVATCPSVGRDGYTWCFGGIDGADRVSDAVACCDEGDRPWCRPMLGATYLTVEAEREHAWVRAVVPGMERIDRRPDDAILARVIQIAASAKGLDRCDGVPMADETSFSTYPVENCIEILWEQEGRDGSLYADDIENLDWEVSELGWNDTVVYSTPAVSACGEQMEGDVSLYWHHPSNTVLVVFQLLPH